MAKENRKYSKKFFRKPFPPNHNPLIGTVPDDTIHNVLDVVSVLQELTINPEQGELVFSEFSTSGFFLVLSCIRDALRFELYHRKKT